MKKSRSQKWLRYFALCYLCALFCSVNVHAQNATDTTTVATKVKLKGKVVDEQQEPLPFVSVMAEGILAGAMTGMDGTYRFEFDGGQDSVVIVYSLIGYEKRRRVLKNPSGNLTLNIVMRDDGKVMNEVTVKDIKRQMGSTQELNTKDLRRMPSTTGNAVEELVATQAGVSTHNELSSQYNVRGGSFDENSVYINGVEVYRPLLISSGQQEGLSVINSDMVEKVNFSAGGFDAKYGDKMSSVLDITYRRPERLEGSVQASLLGVNVYGGYGSKKFSFSNGFRYKSNAYMLNSLQTNAEYRPNFIDYQAYLSWTPNKNWTFDAIGYISRNLYRFVPKDRETNFGTLESVNSFKVYFDGKEQDVFRTLFGTAKLKRRLNNYSNLSLALSAFSTRERETYDIQGQYWLDQTDTQVQLGVGTYMEHARNILTSNVQTLKLNYEYKHNAHHVLSGMSWRKEHIDEHANEWEMRDSSGYSIPHTGVDLMPIYHLKSVNSITTNHLELYAQDTWRHESKMGIISLTYGARLSFWDWNKEWLFSPRASLGFVPNSNDRLTFRLAAGMYYQRPFYRELRDTVTTAAGTFVNLNKNIKSQRSFQLVLGSEYKFKIADRPFKFTAEAYYKAQSNINPYNVDNVKVVYYGKNIATGYVVGADFKIYGEFVPGTDSWISFGLMKAKMNLNGKSLPQPTDQRYNLNFFFSDYFPGTTRWKMNLKASFADGLPFGPPHTGLERNSFRAPAYKRIDIGMNYRLLDNEDRHMKRNIVRNVWLGLDCFNIFGFSNVSGYYWVTDVNGYQYAVPNYLTGRQINGRILIEF
ncbi:MAG: TonB-dependent receptor [Bacteroidales bacterium]|nr:TonB-dependent receptor [Candidatus Physcousia equi]